MKLIKLLVKNVQIFLVEKQWNGISHSIFPVDIYSTIKMAWFPPYLSMYSSLKHVTQVVGLGKFRRILQVCVFFFHCAEGHRIYTPFHGINFTRIQCLHQTTFFSWLGNKSIWKYTLKVKQVECYHWFCVNIK